MAAGDWRMPKTHPNQNLKSGLPASKRSLPPSMPVITLFDHADIYGNGEAEKIFGEVLRENPEMREQDFNCYQMRCAAA